MKPKITLKELVELMDVAELHVCSTNEELGFHGEREINMFRLDADPVVHRYGDRLVSGITNICRLRLTIWIE